MIRCQTVMATAVCCLWTRRAVLTPAYFTCQIIHHKLRFCPWRVGGGASDECSSGTTSDRITKRRIRFIFTSATHTGPTSPVPGPRPIFLKKVQRRVCIASTIVGGDVVIFTASVLASRWDKIFPVIAEMVVSGSYALHKALPVVSSLTCLERQAMYNPPHD